MSNTGRHIFSLWSGFPSIVLRPVFLLAAGIFLTSQVRISAEYQVKAVFLYNFTHFVSWPDTLWASADEPFVIGILGEDPFGNFIDQTVAGETYQGRQFVIKRMPKPQLTTREQVASCNLLYVAANVNPRTVLELCNGLPLLTVGESPDFTARGGVIRFSTRNKKIRLHINNQAAREGGLQVSPQLLRLAETEG